MAKNDLHQNIKDPQIKNMVDLFSGMCRKYDSYEVFVGLLDYGIAQYCPFVPYVSRFDEAEQKTLHKMLDCATEYVQQRANLWTGDQQNPNGWADPFGSMFEAIAGDMKKAAQGLFFTPEPLCTLMASITINKSYIPGQKAAEPACGSGRMVLAANAINPGIFFCANDIDPACAKMTALNMCLNGAVGQVTCMDGLWPTDNNFRFGYQVLPLQMLVEMLPEYVAKMIGVVATIQSAGAYQKTYALDMLQFSECLIGMGDGSLVDTINEQRNARLAAGTPTLNSLFTEALPTGVQGKLF